jgi:transposase
LIEGISADMLLADRAYDTNKIIDFAIENGMQIVIPSKKNRIKQRKYDEYIYRMRHLVENTFLKLKKWRGIATRYAKTTSAFRAAVVMGSIMLWIKLV